MDERLRFVARLLEGEKMAELCREFDISRKTGYKIFQRYKDLGLEGLTDRSRRPFRQANQLPMQIETLIVQLKREHPSWGAPKIREKLRRQHDDVQTPAISTVHAVLDRHGLVKHGRKRRYKAQGTGAVAAAATQRPLVRRLQGRVHARRPELLLSPDHHRLRQPLTAQLRVARRLPRKPTRSRSSSASSMSSACPRRSAPTTGCPSPVAHALFGLSKLAVWWLRLGIAIERIKPGCPQQNGRHERMHLTLKKEATKPAALNLLQQQERFDAFIDGFNHERPHQALQMRYPAELYARPRVRIEDSASSPTRCTTTRSP